MGPLHSREIAWCVGAIGLLFVPLLSLSCRDRDSPPPVIRLLEYGGAMQADWPEPDGLQPPLELRPARIASGMPEQTAFEVQMFRGLANRDSRAALLAPSGSTYRFRLRVPQAAVFRVGLGHLMIPEAVGRAVRFQVALQTEEGQRHLLLDEQLQTDPEGSWQDREISLAGWAGEEAVLELTTSPSASDSLVWAAWAVPEVVGQPIEQGGWNVILISLDTLRADHLGCYGYERPTSPRLDAIAAAGIRFEHAISQSPWTRPSHSSLFTGLYPVAKHGLKPVPLALALWRSGYRTGAITGGGQVSGALGFHVGFETYRIERWIRSIDVAIDWLQAGGGRKSFLFLHTFEIHDPYTDQRFAESLPPGRLEGEFSKALWQHFKRDLSAEEKTYVEALYDGGIAFTDQQLGLLTDELRRRGLLERTILIITSDHGEQFWEHGSWRHGSTMYDHQLRVPLILHLPVRLREQLAGDRWDPEAPGRVIRQQVQLIDLYPTVLDLLDIEMPNRVQGQSLRGLLEGRRVEPRVAFAENTNIASHERKTLRTEQFKLIHSFPKKKHVREYVELYDLSHDPAESVNLIAEHPELAAGMEAQMTAISTGADAESLQTEVPEGISPELRQQLEALGYVGDG